MRLSLDRLAWVYSPPSSGHIGVTRSMLSNIINCKAGVSAAMALKFADAFPKTDARFWLNLQANYELSKALRAGRKLLPPLRKAA